jgi:ArsR family transcriptional regulator
MNTVITPSLDQSVVDSKQPIARSPKYVPALSEAEAREHERLLQALGNHTRLQILSLLQSHGGEINVEEIVEAFPVEQPTISHHLRILRDARLVECRKKGTWAYYYIDLDAWESRVQPALRNIVAFFCTGGRLAES